MSTRPTLGAESDQPRDEWGALAIAIHEAGHAVAARSLLGRVGTVTVEPGSTFAGATAVPDLRREGDKTLLADGRATWVTNGDDYARARDVAERDVMVLLAGEEAEDLAMQRGRWRELIDAGEGAPVIRSAPDVRRMIESAPADAVDISWISLADVEREQVPKCDRTDEAKAWRGVVELNPFREPRVLSAHLEFLRADTRAHLEREWAAVEALAAALLEHGTVSGPAASTIVGKCLT